jgi:hypothetical protein
MSRIGDTPWVCPSCGNFLGGYKKSSKGSEVIGHGRMTNVSGEWAGDVVVDLCKCHDCGVLFAVDEASVTPPD